MDKKQYGRIRRRPTRETPSPEKRDGVSEKTTPPMAPPTRADISETDTKTGPPPPSQPVPEKSPPRPRRRPTSQDSPPRRSERPSRERPVARRTGDRTPTSREKPVLRRSGDKTRPPSPQRKVSRPSVRRVTGSGLKLESIALPALTVMAATAFLYYAAPILVPLVAAVAFAYVLSPVVDLLKKGKIPHIIAVLIVMAVGAVLLSGCGYLVFQESAGLAADMPQYYEAVKGWLVGALSTYQTFQQTSGDILPVLDESLLEGITFADFSGVGGYLFKGIGSVLSSVFGLIMIFLLTLFLLLDQQALRKRLVLVLGDDPRVSGSIIDGINEQIRGFMLVKFVTTVGLAVIFTTGLLIFDVNYAYVWGPLAAVLNLIPYVGAIIGMIPPVIVAAIQTGGITTPAWVLLFFIIIQLLESNVITPKLVGDKVRLNLLAVLLATVYWGWLWGILGVILAVPITAAAKVVCSHIDALRPIAILLGSETETVPAKAS